MERKWGFFSRALVVLTCRFSRYLSFLWNRRPESVVGGGGRVAVILRRVNLGFELAEELTVEGEKRF